MKFKEYRCQPKPAKATTCPMCNRIDKVMAWHEGKKIREVCTRCGITGTRLNIIKIK